MATIQRIIRVQTTVHKDGEIQINDPSLQSGDDVEVIVLLPDSDRKHSALDILEKMPGHRLYESADDVDAYIAAEHATWDH